MRSRGGRWCRCSLTLRRADALELIGVIAKPDLPDIAAGEIHVESAFAAKPIRTLAYRPVARDDPLPVILHIHGGGFVMGSPEMKDVENRLFASELRCTIYSVDYRLAPEAPHPGTAGGHLFDVCLAIIDGSV
jgi:acetyl esterase/lipase